MLKSSEEPVEALVESVIARSKPRQERKNLRKFLTDVVIFMKLARGVKLSKEEQNYQSAPFFAHFLMGRGSEAADARCGK